MTLTLSELQRMTKYKPWKEFNVLLTNECMGINGIICCPDTQEILGYIKRKKKKKPKNVTLDIDVVPVWGYIWRKIFKPVVFQ